MGQVHAEAAKPYSPAAYRRFAPIGGGLYKKLLDLSFPFENISLNRNVDAREKGHFCCNISYFARK
jgi:hypothetical protein